VEDKPETSFEGTNDAGSFVSVRQSQKTGSSVDGSDGEIIYNAATNGLSPDAALQERFTVDTAKNGMFFNSESFIC
jgi:hypothetical protein